MAKVSVASKAVMGMVVTVAGAIAATFPDSALGKICAVVAAGLGAFITVYFTKNTQKFRTGVGDGPVTVGTFLSDSGNQIGKLTADTGAFVGGTVAGTTGVVGSIIDGTIGKLIPGGK